MGRKKNKKTLENEKPIQKKKSESQDTPKKEKNPNAEYRDILINN